MGHSPAVDLLGALLGAGTMGLFGIGLFITLFGWPILVISAVRSLRRIARELERANDYREHYENGVRPGPLGT